MTHNQRLSPFVAAYLEAALWSSRGDDGSPLDGEFSTRDFAPRALNIARRDCDAFEQHARAAGIELFDAGQDGHDFWLTRNHHGAGFWDRPHYNKTVGDALTALADKFGEQDVVVGDDGRLYLEGGRYASVNPHGQFYEIRVASPGARVARRLQGASSLEEARTVLAKYLRDGFGSWGEIWRDGHKVDEFTVSHARRQ